MKVRADTLTAVVSAKQLRRRQIQGDRVSGRKRKACGVHRLRIIGPDMQLCINTAATDVDKVHAQGVQVSQAQPSCT